IQSIDCHGQAVQTQRFELVDPLGKEQPVGTHALYQMRKLGPDQPKGLESLLICQRISRSGDPDDLDERTQHLACHYLADLLQGFGRCQYAARDAWPGLIRAVVTAAAVAALDVALRSDGKMHSAVLMVIAAKAWMPLNIFSPGTCTSHDLIPLYHEKEPCRVLSAGLRCPTEIFLLLPLFQSGKCLNRAKRVTCRYCSLLPLHLVDSTVI